MRPRSTSIVFSELGKYHILHILPAARASSPEAFTEAGAVCRKRGRLRACGRPEATFSWRTPRGWSVGLAGTELRRRPFGELESQGPSVGHLQALDEALPAWDARWALPHLPVPLLPWMPPTPRLPRLPPNCLPVKGWGEGRGQHLIPPLTFSSGVICCHSVPLCQRNPEAIYFQKWTPYPNSFCLAQLFGETLGGLGDPQT